MARSLPSSVSRETLGLILSVIIPEEVVVRVYLLLGALVPPPCDLPPTLCLGAGLPRQDSHRLWLPTGRREAEVGLFRWFPACKVASDWLCLLAEGHGCAQSGLLGTFSPSGFSYFHSFKKWGGGFVFWGCHNKLPQTE